MQEQFVIVGGGAGGLELACKLGRKLGRARVTLVDCRLYHIWKPSLHEVAAGTLDIHQEGLSYQMLAHDNDFTFVYGALTAVDPASRSLTVSAVTSDTGAALLPERQLAFSALCIAVGSVSNYFGVAGAQEHTISLNATEDAERFRLKMLELLTMAELRKESQPQAGLDIVIIGGGATGVELAAELREASSVYADYGFRKLDPARDVRITLLEGAPRILAPLPERVSSAATRLLAKRHVSVVTGCRVVDIQPGSVKDAEGVTRPADICVWAAGIRAPAFLATLGLPTNKSGQLDVTDRLNVSGHTDIYAIGDCAACPGNDGKPVPPRAQAAHQQADYLFDTFVRRATARPAPARPYVYRDYGSLVSIGQQTTVGSLMGSLKGLSWFVEGFYARIMYISLHLMHHQAIMGTLRTGVLAVGRFLVKRTTALVKLH
ncbi:NAD(P)/FAD-dependent oxidoreductase [Janthinobacterium sp. 17J80-10]|uniref:NAD(P)/FAD-dependent oxidoreductase n=1 Tax=Janthinobacterium sp. 17J80-10 TaxID=2497863 RepID=UPI0010055B7D|nr:NAD(P)/FAD-dependent oxidoreductase [Janthinobacterium sp. 17J80-10]QAU34459.1 NAD(P)/FAD-dependent oxidoreductase [Janthinobacterium sp. 17J80-10]